MIDPMMELVPVCPIPGSIHHFADFRPEIEAWPRDADWRVLNRDLMHRTRFEPYNIVWWLMILHEAHITQNSPDGLGNCECHLVYPSQAPDLIDRGRRYWMELVRSPEWAAFPAYWRREFSAVRSGQIYFDGAYRRGDGSCPSSMMTWIQSRAWSQLHGKGVHWAPRWAVEGGTHAQAKMLCAGEASARLLQEYLDANGGLFTRDLLMASFPGVDLMFRHESMAAAA